MKAEPITVAAPTGCQPRCAHPAIEHDFEPVDGGLWHILHVGTIAVLANDLASCVADDCDEGHGLPFEVKVSIYGEDREPIVALNVHGWGESAEMSIDQACQAAAVFARAVQLLAGGEATRRDEVLVAGGQILTLPSASEGIGDLPSGAVHAVERVDVRG